MTALTREQELALIQALEREGFEVIDPTPHRLTCMGLNELGPFVGEYRRLQLTEPARLLAQAIKDRDELREALRKAEWCESYHYDEPLCLHCYGDKKDGHAPDCRLVALLGEEKVDE